MLPFEKCYKSWRYKSWPFTVSERLEKKQQDSAWSKALLENGIQVVEPAINKGSMPDWIQAKSKDLELEISTEAIKLLAERTEGNLLAASQELMKLSLLFPEQDISLESMERSNRVPKDNRKYKSKELWKGKKPLPTFPNSRKNPSKGMPNPAY